MPTIRLVATLASLAVSGALSLTQAQTYENIVVAQFDSSGDPFSSLNVWWGGPVFTQQWDGSQNAPTTFGPNNSGSGALKFTADWTGINGDSGPQPQLMLWNALSGKQWDQSVTVNGTYYDLDFDIMFDPGSAKTANGDYGHIQALVTDAGWNRIQLWDAPAFTNEGWTHVHGHINPATAGVDKVTGFCLNWPWQTGAGNVGAIPGVQTVWLDNIVMTVKTNLVQLFQPPTLTVQPSPQVTPGLNITSAGASVNDRNNIASSTDQSWLGASGPVTYSLKIAKYPDSATYSSYQTHIFLVPSPGTESGPDWNEANCVFLDIQNHSDGTASANFRYKTNQPGGNNMIYHEGTLGSVNSTNGAVGTWSMTWSANTNVTITSPTGETFSTNIPAASAAMFAAPVTAYFGAQPNNSAEIGQRIVLSNVKITGTANPINDSFSGTGLNTNIWVVRASQAQDVFIPISDAAYQVSWTLPAKDFDLQMASTVKGPWASAGLTNTFTVGESMSVTVPKSILPSTKAGYFRMFKAVATKLQVLLPGETAAPGTPTGKKGTPTTASMFDPVHVTVNAVDDNWNVVRTCQDNIQITTDDTAAFLPPNATLVNGTQVFDVIIDDTEIFTITATDLTDSTKAAGVSAPTSRF